MHYVPPSMHVQTVFPPFPRKKHTTLLVHSQTCLAFRYSVLLSLSICISASLLSLRLVVVCSLCLFFSQSRCRQRPPPLTHTIRLDCNASPTDVVCPLHLHGHICLYFVGKTVPYKGFVTQPYHKGPQRGSFHSIPQH